MSGPIQKPEFDRGCLDALADLRNGSTDMAFREGQRVGQYIFESILGRGGMADVWRAWDTQQQKHVAIKVIAEEFVGDANFSVRFLDEIRRHGRLKHPNIVAIINTFAVGGQLCMVMNLIQGESLAAVLERSPEHRLPLGVMLPILTDVLAALDYAHRKGVVHRDVKPSNILLDNAGRRAYLSDFGIALAIGEERRTRTGVPVGTAEYMSPEQIRTPLQLDYRTDVYSLGCVFYETLTGRPPFVGSDFQGSTPSYLAIGSAHVHKTPVPPCQRLSSIPKEINDLIMWALRKDLDRRLPGCAEFARLLVSSQQKLKTTDTATATRSPVRLIAGIALLVAAVSTILYFIVG